jgi:hypothetical protein
MAGCGQKAAVPRTGRVSPQILPNCCVNDTIVARRQPCGRPAAGARHEVAISRHGMPELRLDLWPFRKRRAQGKPGADCTRGLVCKSAHCGRTRAYRFSRNSPAFPAQWFYGVLRALPGERIRLVTVACENLPQAWHQQRVSGPHDLAVRPGVSSGAATPPFRK